MSLRVYNSLKRKKEEFKPIKKGKVGMYVCGITAYDACHLGHARAAVSFDIVYRYLKYKKFKVTYVRNFTDIDDKIIRRANETGTNWKEITELYIKEYGEDMKLLNVESPTKEPKATDHIREMIETIAVLIKRGKAYVSEGSVYYCVRSFEGYGKLSHKKIEDLESGARIAIDETKKDPLDFALWKKSKPGEPKWESPWGEGRPGWHIECSVMSTGYLGQPFDIHGGGRDLIFPHHENEVAQAEGVCDKPFCNYFLHNGFININAEKMSKSLANFLTIKDVVAKHGAETVRYFLVSAHYGSPLDYTEQNMKEAKAALDRFYLLAKRLKTVPLIRNTHMPKNLKDEERVLAESMKGLKSRMEEAMDDDFNTVKAIGHLFETVRIFNKYLDTHRVEDSSFAVWARSEWEKEIRPYREVLGLFHFDPDDYFLSFKQSRASDLDVDTAWVEQKIEERRAARAKKDYKKGDAIREELSRKGIVLKDRSGGKTEWHFE